MGFKLDPKIVGSYAFKFLRFIVKKIFSIIMWIFFIIIFITIAVAGQIWAAVGFATFVAVIYVIKYLRLKLKDEKEQKNSQSTQITSSIDTSFKAPFDK